MELKQIENHWKNWAKEFKTDLRATTKSGTAKELEINALVQAITQYKTSNDDISILEVGCGNGHNCFALQHAFKDAKITGVDFIKEMVAHAQELNTHFNTNIPFYQGNIIELTKQVSLNELYDFVFTVRCVINLNSDELQHQGVEQLAAKVRSGGYLIMIENQQSTHDNQNNLREIGGLKPRTAAQFNHFMNESALLAHAKSLNLQHEKSYNFSSLHDIVLYTLVPMINGGDVDYEHPVVQAAADLINAGGDKLMDSFGDFGQNKLFIFKKI